MNEWRDTTLGSFIALQRGHDLTEPERRSGAVPVMGSAGQNGFHDTALARGPGIVIGRSGASFGQVHYSPVDFWPHNTALYVTNFNGNDERFAFYFLKAIDFSRYNSGSAQPSLNRNFIYPITVRVPPLAEQQAIARILGTLDDKIELNRRMNETLEGMARALFKSWFVDFDPVRAKLDGRPPPNLDPATAALFPDHFEHTDTELVPMGWRIQRVGDFIERLGVGTKYDQWTISPKGSVPVLDQSKSGVIGYHNEKAGVIASIDDPVVVFANHTCNMRLVTLPFSAIQNVLPFKGKSLSTVWAYFATLGLQAFTEYKGHWPDFIIKEVVVPTAELADCFARIALPCIAASRKNDEQKEALAALRDALLPKLLSGKIRVRAAEKLVEKVS